MPSCILDNCCFCFDLRTGCLIIGYMELVAEIILVALGLLLLLGSGAVAAQAQDADAQAAGGAMLVVSGLVLLILLFLLAFTIVLLVGLHKNKRGHVKAYLIYSCIFLVLYVIMFFASFAGTINAMDVIKNLITIVVGIYYTLVIRSYYYKMDDKRPQVYSAA